MGKYFFFGILNLQEKIINWDYRFARKKLITNIKNNIEYENFGI